MSNLQDLVLKFLLLSEILLFSDFGREKDIFLFLHNYDIKVYFII